jgi:hypothetical protein
MKELYNFTVNNSKEVEIKTETPDGTLIKKEKKEFPVTIILKSPSRLEKEEAAAFEAMEWSKAVKEGFLTKQMLAKVYADNGGVFSKEEVKLSNQLADEYNSKVLEWQQALINKKEEEVLDRLKNEVTELYSKIQINENKKEDLFRNSAETRARDKTIQWLILFLTYIKDETEKVSPFFGVGDFDSKLNKLYELSELDDDFNKTVIEKAALYISFWYMGRLNSKEDFEFLNSELDKTEETVES